MPDDVLGRPLAVRPDDPRVEAPEGVAARLPVVPAVGVQIAGGWPTGGTGKDATPAVPAPPGPPPSGPSRSGPSASAPPVEPAATPAPEPVAPPAGTGWPHRPESVPATGPRGITARLGWVVDPLPVVTAPGVAGPAVAPGSPPAGTADAALPDAALPGAAPEKDAAPGPAALADRAVPGAAVPGAAVPVGGAPVPAATDGAATDGAATDGAATDGAAPDGAGPDPAGSGAPGTPGTGEPGGGGPPAPEPAPRTDPTPRTDEDTAERILAVPAAGSWPAGRPAGVVDAWWATLASAPLPDTLLGDGSGLSGEGLDLTHAHPSGLATLLAGRPTRLSSLFREPAAHAAARRRARDIRHAVGQLAEERGVRAGHLALGLVSWWAGDVAWPQRDGRAGTPVRAPLLLRGCDVLPRGAGHDDYELHLDQTVSVNPEVLRRLREDHGIRLDSTALGGLAFGPNGFDPAPVYAHLLDVCHGVPGFTIEQRVVVGSFTAGSGALLGDLDSAAPALRAHPVVGPLLAGAVPPEEAPGAAPGDRPFAGEDAPPQPELCVLPLDPAQLRAVRAVTGGRSVALEGPPGSGLTQTLAAAVLALVGSGERVLVVTPHQASARTLAARITASGLSDLVLDLHDGAGDRESMLAALGDDLTAAARGEVAERAARVADATGDGDVAAVAAATSVLAAASTALHTVREPWGVSAYDAMEALAALMATDVAPRTRVRLGAEVCRRLDAEARDQLRDDLRRAAAAGAFTLTRQDTRWLDAVVRDDVEAERALARAVTARDGLAEARRLMAAVAEAAGIDPVPDPSGWRPALELLCGVRDTLDSLLPAVYEQPLDDLVAAVGGDGPPGAGRLARRSLRRRARALVRPGVHVKDLRRLLVIASQQRARWAEVSSGGGWPRVPTGLAEAGAAVETVLGALTDLGRYLHGTSTPDLGTLPLDPLADRLADLAADREGVAAQPERTVLLRRLREAGLGDLVADLRERRCTADDVDGELDLAWWTSVLEAVIRSDPVLARHDPAQPAAALDELRSAPDRLSAAGTARIRRTVTAAAARAVASNPVQAAWLRSEVHRGHRSVWPADLFRRAGDVVAALRPVVVMSPDAVARCLPAAAPGRPAFDTVVVDDAGQVGMPEAAAALARGRRVLLAGDRHGLPPASGRPAVLEALGPWVERHRLDRDHRVRDGRLLTSIRRAYPGVWAVTPGAAASPPLTLEHVWVTLGPGPATPAADAEVQRVVDLVTEHAGRRPGESLMVVTLGARHAERVVEALRAEVAHRPELARWLEVHWTGRISESFAVRPVHRLCGLERDAVIFSVGLGRTPHGQVLHRFGVLDGSYGRSCLTVAMTRARRRVTLVSSFTASDLDPDRLSTDGSRMLRELLALAEDPALRGDHDPATTAGAAPGVRPGRAPGGAGTPDPLVADLRDRLVAVGLPVGPGIDAADWPVPLVLADPREPGHLLLAVDVDGEEHAAVGSVVTRDAHRREGFERAGWGYVRVAAMDLFCDPAAEVERVRRAWRVAGGRSEQETAATGLILGRPRVRGTWPGVPVGRPLGEYSAGQLQQVASWVLTDGVPRRVDELVAGVCEALQLVLRGPRVEALVTDAVRALASGTTLEG